MLQSIVYNVIIMFVVFPHDAWLTCFVSEWSYIYTFINMLASNHAIELVNTTSGAFHSTLDK